MRSRLAWIITATALVAGLLWLDANRAGPTTELSQCNLALTRAERPAADVLIAGSSRTGLAIDPVAMEGMLTAAGLDEPTVDRLALGRNTLRVTGALVDNYLTNRGAPEAIVLELSFMTPRTLERIEAIAGSTPAEVYLYRRDLNLIDYGQIASAPAVALPYTEAEGPLARTRFALEGVVTRSGALTYQLASEAGDELTVDECSKDTWTRESTWPSDFAFSWDDAETIDAPAKRIADLRRQIGNEAPDRELRSWQLDSATGVRYPYDVDADYRRGEMRILEQVVDQAAEHGVPVVLLPLTLYGTVPDRADLERLDEQFVGDAHVFDLYATTEVDLSTYWYDDAHLELGPAVELTTALLAQHLLDQGFLNGEPTDRTDA
ncbi:MAG: hypothetical protein AAF567_07265 [Actinomycetota bacterium]